MRPLVVVMLVSVLPLVGCGPRPTIEERAQAIAAFATVEAVFQHPRCRNCHISGDSPLQFDAGLPHVMGVVRGSKGHGAPGLPCATCHGVSNAPASYGPDAPPGAPHWGLPPPDHKMAWMGVSAAELCEMIKDKKRNGSRDFEALTKHVSEDSLVLWGWHPGGHRAPVSVPHDVFVARFKQWAAAGGPCPTEKVAAAHTAAISLADVAGTWRLRSISETGDSTIATYQLIATAHPSGWTFNVPARNPIPVRVTTAGDSIMTEAGPFESVLRKGVPVTLRGVLRLEGGKLAGTTVAAFGRDGPDSVLRVRTEGTRLR